MSKEIGYTVIYHSFDAEDYFLDYRYCINVEEVEKIIIEDLKKRKLKDSDIENTGTWEGDFCVLKGKIKPLEIYIDIVKQRKIRLK